MRRLSLIIVVLLLLAGTLLVWLTATQSGLRWGYEQAGRYLPGELRIAEMRGRLIRADTPGRFGLASSWSRSSIEACR